MKIAKEGLLFILPALVLAILVARPGWWPGTALFVLLAAAFVFFFRDPARRPPDGERLAVSPADGKVVRIDTLPSHPDLPGPVTRVCIFLSLYDVHVTRFPLAGEVRRVDRASGAFLPAYRDEAGEVNASNGILLENGPMPYFVKQIVGVAARRIKCFVRAGDPAVRGGRMGLMYFGSRVEVAFPPGVRVTAGVGDRVRAGESVIAEVGP
jgi:phosphatidylserine decarboxylase